MAYLTNTATDVPDLLDKLDTFVRANGWSLVTSDLTTANKLYIWSGPGRGAAFTCGIRNYQTPASDIYNIEVFGSSGYSGLFLYNQQPDFTSVGVPLHNSSMTFWAVVDSNRLIVVVKIASTYQSFHIGTIYSYFPATQIPFPFLITGMLNGPMQTRYSDSVDFYNPGYMCGFKGNLSNGSYFYTNGNARFYTPNCLWVNVKIWPCPNNYGLPVQRTIQSDLGISTGDYVLDPLILYTDHSYFNDIDSVIVNKIYAVNDNKTVVGTLWGEIIGVYKVSGFANAAENVLTIGGIDYIIFQEAGQTGYNDYFALRLS